MIRRWMHVLAGAAAPLIVAVPVLSARQIDMTQRQQEVRARETAFARSMADPANLMGAVELTPFQGV